MVKGTFIIRGMYIHDYPNIKDTLIFFSLKVAIIMVKHAIYSPERNDIF